MSPETKAALDKIKKLLRMKRGGTQGEVENAMRMAQEIAEKHGIDLAGVNADDDGPKADQPTGHSGTDPIARIQWECKYAMLICEHFFHVTAFTEQDRLGRRRVVMVGAEWRREVAWHIYHFLVRHFRWTWTHKRGRLRNRQAFLHGMYVGLWCKLKEGQPDAPQVNGVVVVDREKKRQDDYIAAQFGKMTTSAVVPENDSEKAKWAGFHEGQKTELRPAVTAGAAAPVLLLG